MPSDGDLPRGAYQALLTDALSARLEGGSGQARLDTLDKAEAADRLATHLRAILEQALAAIPSKDRLGRQVALTNALLAWLESDGQRAGEGQRVIDPPNMLRLLTDPLLPGQAPPELPDVPLLDHDLLTNAPGEPSLAHALRGELETADRVDGVIAFIRWTGLRYLFPALERLRRAGRRIRILTTTFTAHRQHKGPVEVALAP